MRKTRPETIFPPGTWIAFEAQCGFGEYKPYVGIVTRNSWHGSWWPSIKRGRGFRCAPEYRFRLASDDEISSLLNNVGIPTKSKTIVHAYADVPALTAEVRRLREIIAGIGEPIINCTLRETSVTDCVTNIWCIECKHYITEDRPHASDCIVNTIRECREKLGESK